MKTIRLAVAAILSASIIVAAPTAASSEVPGKPFTSTECEGYSDSVARLYTAGLGRQPEQGGFDFWITEYTLGNWTFPRMAEFFVNSPEFQASYGELDQDGFIRQLYRNVLGREGENGGVAFWNDQMSNGMSRATVLMRFAESPENIQRSGTAEPTLGSFNEGLEEGPWRCGPDLTPFLFNLDDFSTGWTENTQLGRAPTTGCDSSLRMPDDIDQAGFQLFDTGPGVSQGLYIAPTVHGADRYMTKVREASETCGSYVDAAGFDVTIQPVNFPRFGDDSAAVRIVATRSDGWEFHHDFVAVRTGSVVTTVIYWESFSVFSDNTEEWVRLAVERIDTIPLDG